MYKGEPPTASAATLAAAGGGGGSSSNSGGTAPGCKRKLDRYNDSVEDIDGDRAKPVIMTDAQSLSDGDGDSSCFAADDRRSWSCDSNCGADARKDFDANEPGIKLQSGGGSSSRASLDAAGRDGSVASANMAGALSEGGTGTASDGKERRRRRQKLANKDNLICQVCGDKANGYNFGAVTCESCKAFFRRNALKNWDIKCNFEGACKIDPFTRKFCTACRLQKCFAINMKKEWILDEEALKKRKKLSRRTSAGTATAGAQAGSGASIVAADSCVVDEGASLDSSSSGGSSIRRGSSLLHESAAVVASADSSAGPQPTGPTKRVVAGAAAAVPVAGPAGAGGAYKSMGPARLAPRPPSPRGSGSRGCTVVVGACSSSTSPHAAACSADGSGGSVAASASAVIDGIACYGGAAAAEYQTVPLTEDDSRMIASILLNHSQTADPFERPFWDKVTVETPARPQEVYNMADGFIRRLIKFVKVLPEFSSLSQDDQIALLKGGIMETLVIRSAYTYDPSIGGFKITSAETHEQRELKISMMFRGLGEEVYAEHMKFITSFNTSAKWNKTIIVLAMVINLFSPDRAGLSSTVKPAVAAAEDRYSQLLLRYLQSLYPPAEAAAMYPRILMKLTDVRSYGEMTARQVARVSATDMEPLMKEIFNLK